MYILKRVKHVEEPGKIVVLGLQLYPCVSYISKLQGILKSVDGIIFHAFNFCTPFLLFFHSFFKQENCKLMLCLTGNTK